MISPALRDTLRLSFTVAVVNGFASLTGLSFAMYASLAVLSVTVGNYGNTLELGRQRLIGTTLGAIVVFFGYQAWGEHLPLFVALPLALLLARLIAGSLRLTVGYTVCCFVVIMGWLLHEQQLDSWIPLRLLWTAFGVIMALVSLRLFWPSRARIQQRQGLLQLLVDLGTTLQNYIEQTPQSERRRSLTQEVRRLRNTLLALREQRKGALLELGPLAASHPVARMWNLLDQACEALILDLDELRRLPDPLWQAWGLSSEHDTAIHFSSAVAQRLLRWQEVLRSSSQLQPPPGEPRPILELAGLRSAAAQTRFDRLSPEQLERVAARMVVLNRIDHTMAFTERQWQSIVS